MAQPELLFDIGLLEYALKAPAGTLADDEYTKLMAAMASEKVRSVAGQPTWVDPEKDPLTGDQTHAPWRATHIALNLAKQAWNDRGNLQRRTAGPVSETFFENGVRGLDLQTEDLAWLEDQQPGGNSNGLWILGHYGTKVASVTRTETPDGYSFSNGDLNFAHGMDMRGPADADLW